VLLQAYPRILGHKFKYDIFTDLAEGLTGTTHQDLMDRILELNEEIHVTVYWRWMIKNEFSPSLMKLRKQL
jgi:hypothetical protein